MPTTTVERISTDYALQASQIQEAVRAIQQDVENHERNALLSDIRRLRRWLNSLEYEVMDGPRSGSSDAC